MDKQLALHDRTVKLICIPALGILVPNLSGLITNRLYRSTELLGSYLYFITLFFLIWEGNVRLLIFIRKKYPWNGKSYPRIIIALFFANIIYSSLLSFFWLKVWKMWSPETDDDRGQMANCILLVIIAACFIINIYEILFLNREKEQNEYRVEKLNIAKAQAELEALKNQIDPTSSLTPLIPCLISSPATPLAPGVTTIPSPASIGISSAIGKETSSCSGKRSNS